MSENEPNVEPDNTAIHGPCEQRVRNSLFGTDFYEDIPLQFSNRNISFLGVLVNRTGLPQPLSKGNTGLSCFETDGIGRVATVAS